MGIEPPENAIWFEDDLEAQAEIEKEREAEAKAIAKKQSKRTKNPLI